MTKAYAQHGDAAGTFLGHPKGLFVLFFAEMWERFSYYGMRALLIFYLTKHWLFSDGEAGVIYGAYTALVYITPVLGGYLADRWLGQRKAVLYGAVTRRPDDRYDFGFRLYDPYRQCQLVSYNFTATREQWRRIAHKIADVVYARMTGETGIFVRHPFHHVAAQAQGHQAFERGALSHQGADTHGGVHFVA